MRFECEDFIPFTHERYGIVGCYGCERVKIQVDAVSCSKEYWCISVLVPVMEADSDFFFCKEYEEMTSVRLLFCENCRLLNVENRCDIRKEMKKIVVRFDWNGI